MKKYGDLKNNQNSPILEALNRGTNQNIHSFRSVEEFIRGLLGQNFNSNAFISSEPVINEIPSKENKIIQQHIKMPSEFLYEPQREKTEIESEIKGEIKFPKENSKSSAYKIYRDKEENFECDIYVQGAKLSNSQVRLIFDHDIYNLVFYGKVYKDGRCIIPLKKMGIYPENSTGRVRLEVIVEDTIFIPWEETFIVEESKKVAVKVKNKKN